MIENFTVSNALAILPGPRTSFLDHLMPLCHYWKIPLLCTDQWVYTCAQTFYPSTEIILATHETFQEILSRYQTFVTVEPCRLHKYAFQFGEFLYKGHATTITGFHGNPTKFRDEYWIERYAHEDIILLYGDYLIDYFKEKNVWERLNKRVMIGNLRRVFYEKHKDFFEAVAKPHLFPTCRRKTVLWATTWSFPPQLEHFSTVFAQVPEDFQLLVKLHPFMYRLYPDKISELKEKYQDRLEILFLDEIPLIYPLLEQADIYLGDYSSVAYDFLSFNRPLFFMIKEKYTWATCISDIHKLFDYFNREDALFESRKKMYSYVFENS